MQRFAFTIALIFLGSCLIEANTFEKVKFEEKTSVTEGPYDPPNYEDKAGRARYLVHHVGWGVLSTISTQDSIKGFPFGNIASMSDGPVENSTGIPYFYVFDSDATMRDVKAHNAVSFTVTEAETEYCRSQGMDFEDPRCSRLTLTGSISKDLSEDETAFALNALFTRHLEMKDWEKEAPGHHFYPARFNIEHIWFLDYFGYPSPVTLEDYFAANPK